MLLVFSFSFPLSGYINVVPLLTFNLFHFQFSSARPSPFLQEGLFTELAHAQINYISKLEIARYGKFSCSALTANSISNHADNVLESTMGALGFAKRKKSSNYKRIMRKPFISPADN